MHGEVFDTDALLHVAALGLDTYRGTWLRLAHDVALNGRLPAERRPALGRAEGLLAGLGPYLFG